MFAGLWDISISAALLPMPHHREAELFISWELHIF